MAKIKRRAFGARELIPNYLIITTMLDVSLQGISIPRDNIVVYSVVNQDIVRCVEYVYSIMATAAARAPTRPTLANCWEAPAVTMVADGDGVPVGLVPLTPGALLLPLATPVQLGATMVVFLTEMSVLRSSD